MLPVSDFKIKTKSKSPFNLVGKIKVQLLMVFTFILAALFFGQLVFANNLAVDGQKLLQIEEEVKRLDAENTTLKMIIAKESSLATLSQKAVKMGYIKPTELLRR